MVGQTAEKRRNAVLGRDGKTTRRKVLENLVKAVEVTPLTRLRVPGIMDKRPGMSPGVFYQYFRNIEEAILAIEGEKPSMELTERTLEVIAFLKGERSRGITK